MKSRNSSFWLYILGIYILLQFLWWAWMLIDLNTQIQLLEAANNSKTNVSDDFLNRKIAMIIGEGSVFILLLSFGFFQVKRALKKELESAKKQRNFLLSVTHELNSPIAGVQLNLETALNRKVDEEKQLKLLRNALEQNSRLKSLVENILTSTRLEENVLQLNKSQVNISELTLQIARHFNSDLTIVETGKIESNIVAKIDKLAFESILKNLIENAVKYSDNDCKVELKLFLKNNKIFVAVIDQGIGISKDNLEKIFDRFYRVQNEETRNTKGTGLGLYIAKELTELMNGELTVTSSVGKGSTFTLTLNQENE